jgi:protein-S-isoprenylcysteine O-methyltransferase Ste14
MKTAPPIDTIDSVNESPDLSAGVRKRMIQVVIQAVLIVAILLLTSGRLDWVWLWVYLGVGMCILVLNTRVMPRELIAERGRLQAGAKSWDRRLTSLITIPILAMIFIVGLDERFGWTNELPIMFHLIGVGLFLLGQLIFTWSMAANKFFSTAVRIQMDRSHTVVSGGPYQYIRHPGYVGMILTYLGMPLLFGSLWGFVPTGLALCLLILRTALEDRTLQAELEGYDAYAARVRYRLVPGLW